MNMTGEYHVAAPRERVFDALNDPEILRQCIPGCDTLEKLSDTEMEATVVAKVGPVRAKFKGQVTISDLVYPESYTITGQGKGGSAGFAKGRAVVRLQPNGAATIMAYEVKVDIGGKLAQLGGRLIDSTSKKMAGDFFKAFSDLVASESEQEETERPPEPKEEEAGKGLNPIVWVVGIAVIAFAAIYLFMR